MYTVVSHRIKTPVPQAMLFKHQCLFITPCMSVSLYVYNLPYTMLYLLTDIVLTKMNFLSLPTLAILSIPVKKSSNLQTYLEKKKVFMMLSSYQGCSFLDVFSPPFHLCS